MADRQVFSMVNQAHQRRGILAELVNNLDICILKNNLDEIAARRRKRHVSKVSILRRIFRSL